jgi:FkbM family methyltransferase
LAPRGKSFLINATLKLCGNDFSDVITTSGGVKFYIDKITPMHRSIFFGDHYEKKETELVKKILFPGCVAFDVGANLGWYSILMSKLVGRGGAVYAFEVAESLAGQLAKNIQINQADNVKVINCAVGDRNQNIRYFYDRFDNTANLNPDLLSNEIRESEIKMIKIDDFCEGCGMERLDFIKCDIDGYENFFLRGASRTIKTYRPIIIIEALEMAQKKAGLSVVDIVEFLIENNYNLFSVENMNKINKEMLANIDESYVDNFLSIPKEKMVSFKHLFCDVSQTPIEQSLQYASGARQDCEPDF